MSNSKPGLFGRLKRAISGTLNEAVDSLSDPGQELALLLDDLAAQIQAGRGGSQAGDGRQEGDGAQARGGSKEARGGGRPAPSRPSSWATTAWPGPALERKAEVTQEVEDSKVALVQQTKLVEEMAVSIKESKKKLKALNQRRGTLMAQARAAKKGETIGSDFGSGAASRLDEIEGKIAALEAYNEVMSETDGGRIEEANIDAKLAELDEKSAVDDELEALKAKMKAKAALTEAKDDAKDED